MRTTDFIVLEIFAKKKHSTHGQCKKWNHKRASTFADILVESGIKTSNAVILFCEFTGVSFLLLCRPKLCFVWWGSCCPEGKDGSSFLYWINFGRGLANQIPWLQASQVLLFSASLFKKYAMTLGILLIMPVYSMSVVNETWYSLKRMGRHGGSNMQVLGPQTG